LIIPPARDQLLERDSSSKIGFRSWLLEIPFKCEFLVLPKTTAFWKFLLNETFLFFPKSLHSENSAIDDIPFFHFKVISRS
jgi:hypothetical protein